MPQRLRVDREPEVAIFRMPLTQRPTREQLTNQELASSNQKLQTRIQKLTTAYQLVEHQNVQLRDRCLRLQNRVDELKLHLADIKVGSGHRRGID